MAFDPTLPFEEVDELEPINEEPIVKPAASSFDINQPFEEVDESSIGTQASIPYQYDKSRFRPKAKTPEEKEVGTIEGITNAAKNAFDSSRQAMDVIGGVTPEEAKNISKIEYDKQSRKLAPGYDEYQKAEGMDAVWAFAKNPIEVTSNIIAEGLAGSLPALGAGLAAGGAGALIGAPTGIGAPIGFTAGQIAGTFAGSLATEYGGKILEEMQNEGMDIQDPESIQKFFANQTLVDAAKDKALKRGVPIAAFDAISAGIGGKLGRVIGKQFITKTGEAAAELGVQAGLGGGGEIAGSLVAGDPIEGKAVFGEIIGEAGPGAAEIVTGRIADRQARLKAQEEAKIKAASELSTTLEENSAPLTAAAVKSTTATTIEQDKLAAQLEEQLDAEELVAVKEPTAAPPTAIPTKDDYVARYSAIAQVAPEELTRAEQSFTSELATAATEEARANAQNALEAIKEVKATITPPAPPVEATITPAVTPAVTTAQPTPTYATEEIIQPEGVRPEPQDGTQVETEEAGVSGGLQPPARGEEEGQVIFGLRSVADNTATREQISALSEAGLVDIVKGKPVINEDGAAILAQPAAPAIVEQEPVTTPALEEAVTPAPIAEAPVVSEEGGQVSEITTAPTIGEEPQVSPEIENLIQRAESATTREEASQIGRDFAALDPSLPPPPSAEYEIVKAISDKAGRRPYNANVLTEENITAAKEAGLVTKTKVPKLTESGRSLVTDGDRVARDREMAIGDITDRVTDQTVSAWDAKNDPASSAFQARIATQQAAPTIAEAAPVKPITPAPVTEQAAPAEVLPLYENPEAFPTIRNANTKKEITDALSEVKKQAKQFGFAKDDQFVKSAEILADRRLSEIKPAEAPAPEVAPVEKPSPIESFKGNIKNSGFKYITYSDFRKNQKTEDWENEGGVTIDESYYPTAVVGDTSVAFTTNGLSLYKGRVEVSYEADVDASGNNIFTIERIVTPEGKRGMGSASKALSEVTSSADKAGLTLQLEPAAVKPLIKKGGKGLTSKQLVDWYKRNGFVQKFEGSDLILIRQPATPTPAVSETITEPAEAAVTAQPTEFGFVKDIDSARENIKKNLIRFASGMSGLSDMRRGSYARAGHRNYGIGFDVGLLSKKTISELAIFIVNLDTQVFIDSGAFSSFKKAIKEGRTVEALDFDRILAKYDSIIDEIDKVNAVEKTDYPRPMLVMPDVIGNQKASLDLIDKHKNWIATSISMDLSVPIIPIPLGELSLSDAYSSIIDILKTNTLGLEIDPNKFVVGIPSNAEAISRDKLSEFLKQSQPPRIHFLGAAADKNISPLIDAVAQNSPNTQVTADASKVRSAILNGVAKGKTRQQAIFDALYQEDDPNVVLESIGKNPEQLTPTAPIEAVAPSGIAVGNRIKLGKSPQTYTIEEEIPQSANDKKFGEQYYSVKNEKTGETQVVEKNDMKPVSSRRRKMASEPDPLPENERYGQVKLNQRIQRYFGGKIPDRVYVVDDAVDKEKKYQAAYYPDLGILIVNNAYIKKNANVGDIIAHELGHYAFGDKKFKAAFDNFYNSLSPEDKAKIDKIVEESYNEETEESQIEESKVIAFTSYTIVNPQRRSLWNAVLDALKAFANKVFGKNFQMSDPNRTALAILSTAKKRFAAGEEIVREDTKAKRAAEQAQDARFAELEARAKAGDKEAEAEAQRMVDEAAKEAGYVLKGFHGSPEKNITQFKNPTWVAKSEYLAELYSESFQGDDLVLGRVYPVVVNPEKTLKLWRFKDWVDLVEKLAPDNNKLKNEILKSQSNDAFGIPIFQFDDPDRGNKISQWRKENGNWDNFKKTTLEKRARAKRLGEEYFSWNTDGYDLSSTWKEGFDQSTANFSNQMNLVNALFDLGYDTLGQLESGRNASTDAGYLVKNPSNQIKSADPFTYDDAGNLIPLSERFQSSEPDIRRMAVEAEPRTEQVAGRTDRGTPIITTPVGIIKQTNEVLRKNFFDGTTVSDEATKNAWLYISRLLDIESGNANELAGEINDVVDAETNSDSRMGASLFSVSLANYSAKLAALGDSTMLSFLVRRINKMPVDKYAGGRSEAGEALRGAGEYDIDGYGALKVEQKAKRDRTAAEIFARGNPTKEQVKAVSDAIDAADNATIGTPEEVASDVEQIEKRTKRNITKKLETLLKKGSLKEMIASIKNTPLEEQQAPGWIEKVIKGYLEQAGLTGDAATTAAKLYDSILSERFVEAKQKAFEETLGRSAPWNNYLSRNSRMAKDSLKKIQVAIRTGVLDPSKTIESVIAKENGWDGFTKEQFERIVQLDNIINNPDNDDVTRREAMSELNKIIADAKLPVRFKDALGAYYVGQALMGIPTAFVNIVSPLGFSIRNLMTDISIYAFTDPARIPIAFESFLDSMRSWYDQTSYAFKNQIYLNDVVEYLNGQNVLRELFDRGKKQWANGEYAAGFANMAVGMAQITGRVLSSLDQGAIAALENQNITRYAMEALAGNTKGRVPKDKLKEFANMILHTKRRVIAESVSSGMSRDRAGVLADLAVKSEIMAALATTEAGPMSVLDSAINDALLSVGRNKTVTIIDGFEVERKKLADSGIISYPPIRMLEMIAEKAGKEGSGMQIFSKMLYGFAIVPARTFSNAAWFSPVGFLRLGVDAYKKSKGQDSPYAMSLQTDAQFKQRLTDAIAGSIVMIALAALRAGSSDDEDDKLFKIVITGNGPSAVADKQYHDTWNKKYSPYTFHIIMGGKTTKINIGRGGEALFFPIMLAGALDDWEIKRKQNLTKKKPSDLNDAAEMLGSSFFALAQRGPYAAFTQPLFDASSQGRVTESLASQAGYFGKTFIPILGTSVARNITDFINDPVDRSSVEGAIYANTPIVGPWMGTKALNALGQPVRADDWGDKLFKLGVPVVFSFPKNTPMNEVNELILKQGGGPSFPTRTNAQNRFGDTLTDKEFEAYVREYGKVMSDRMFKNRSKLERMKPSDYDDELEKYARGYSAGDFKVKGASDMAVQAVKRMRQ